MAIKNQLGALPRLAPDVGAVPHLHLGQMCQDFVEDIALAVRGDNEDKELALSIGKADERLKKSVISSIAKFGLADHDEMQAEILTKSANEFLMQRITLQLSDLMSRTQSTGTSP